ncbi:MAG TPA: glycosyltransferase family 2 protein [Leptolyngbyaceae cyanobacterium M33_DOE_097]|uniref:Glycosyltransferase n=1 Tax=Oscillatoriales cyanobacterium SpSt-418 TaxID=2282169 RepID=A0A7C3PEK9_9CYAN|nr:glycosyltransferase family 2 protein [Leptolyngbyaceae cyanobacterium M33_DOE_097]
MSIQLLSIGLQGIVLGLGMMLFIPIFLLLVECVAAAFAPVALAPTESRATNLRVGVLMPAHNEAMTLPMTLKRLTPELQPNDLLLVVADNCEDETAAIARSFGATVLERFDSERRGKGFALDYGLNFMEQNPPDVIVIVDADCLVEPGAIHHIAQLAVAQKRPVQATYLLEQPLQPKPKDAISALAFTVKNLVRPLGLRQFGMPCLLTGTGMAFPWEMIRNVPLASGNIVEDMQLSLDLAIAGTPCLFCREARVTGVLPQQEKAATSQRTRWEHGHLQTIKTQVPRLLAAALRQGRLDLLVLGLDLAIPPLSMLVLLWLAATLFAAATALVTGFQAGLWFLLLCGGLIAVAIFLAWFRFCRAELPLKTLLAIPLYVLWKIPLYFKFLVKPQTKWVRTDRDATKPSDP